MPSNAESLQLRVRSGPMRLLAIAILCLLYPASWIAGAVLLRNAIAALGSGQISWALPPEHVLHWHYLSGTAIALTLVGLSYARAHVIDAERDRLHAEWKLLRGQLNPHFLFNTLHTLFAQAQVDPDAGAEGVDRLSRLLRFSLLVHRDDIPAVSLDEEWGFTEDYLHLEAARLEGGLEWHVAIADGAHDCAVPPLLLQPLAENAVRYAAANTDCVISFSADVQGDDLVIRFADNGPGAVEEAVMNSRGVGLKSARARIALMTSKPNAFTVDTAPGAGFTVVLRIPRVAVEPTRHRPSMVAQ